MMVGSSLASMSAVTLSVEVPVPGLFLLEAGPVLLLQAPSTAALARPSIAVSARMVISRAPIEVSVCWAQTPVVRALVSVLSVNAYYARIGLRWQTGPAPMDA